MTQREQQVLSAIRAAFAGVTLGGGIGLREADGLDDYANAETLARYRERDEKRDWTAIPSADLDRYYCGLWSLDADGVRFHLPAYLVADLEGKLRTGDVLFHLVYLGDGATERFASLSPAQRAAVREFLLLHLAVPEREFVHPMIETALREYWGVPKEE
jgi:hypothetical protein